MADHDPPADIQLGPAPRLITETFVSNVGSSHGFSATLQVHNAGVIVITDWDAYGFEEGDRAELEIWDGWQALRRDGRRGVVPAPYYSADLALRVPGGARYEIRITGGDWAT